MNGGFLLPWLRTTTLGRLLLRYQIAVVSLAGLGKASLIVQPVLVQIPCAIFVNALLLKLHNPVVLSLSHLCKRGIDDSGDRGTNPGYCYNI